MSKFQVTILCEDRRHQQFVYRYLRKAGFGKHEIVSEDLPGRAGGAGEQWVRARYPVAVKEYRRRAAKGALIAVIDADTYEVSRRARQLEQTLGKDIREDHESVVHFIPKRNIETWILHLNGKQVDEETDYKKGNVDDLIPAASAKFHEWIAQPPPDCLASLKAAIEETKRLQ